METKIELVDGIAKITLIPVSAIEKALVNTMNVFNAKIEVHRPNLTTIDDTKTVEIVDDRTVTALVITLTNI